MISLNQWLEEYQDGSFTKLSLINDEDLQWFELLDRSKERLFGRVWESYISVSNQKISFAELIDLWIALTRRYWACYCSSKTFCLANFLWAVWACFTPYYFGVGMRFIMPKNGPWAVFGVKVGKESKKIWIYYEIFWYCWYGSEKWVDRDRRLSEISWKISNNWSKTSKGSLVVWCS